MSDAPAVEHVIVPAGEVEAPQVEVIEARSEAEVAAIEARSEAEVAAIEASGEVAVELAEVQEEAWRAEVSGLRTDLAALSERVTLTEAAMSENLSLILARLPPPVIVTEAETETTTSDPGEAADRSEAGTNPSAVAEQAVEAAQVLPRKRLHAWI